MRSVVMGLGVLMGLASVARGDEFGGFEGQFVIEGEAPPPPAAAAGGVAICPAGAHPDESLVVDPKTKGIANIFIYLSKPPANIPPALQVSSTPEVVFDNKGCRYVPHAAVVRTDQEMRFTNSDGMAHNIHTYTLFNPPQNFLVTANDQKGSAFPVKMAERLPLPVKCDVHPWMQGMVLVVDHPYAVVTDAQGKFKMSGLPEGDHSFRVWHENKGYLERDWKVTIVAGTTVQVPSVTVPSTWVSPKQK